MKTKSQKVLRGILHSPRPLNLNSVKKDLADSRPVKTIKKEKYRFHYLIACSVKLTCIVTVMILKNTFGNIKINCFYLRELGRGNCAVELACLQMLNISLRKIIKSSQSANRHQITYFLFSTGE